MFYQQVAFSFVCLTVIRAIAQPSKPNIIYILVDDVGWADFNYNVEGNTTIPTPNIDRLAAQGIKLKSHYVQPSCTPSRASLLTGRYATNTGLNVPMVPGAIVGLPKNMLTMPQLLRKAGYSAHMVGKWHLGQAKWADCPVGRGFETFTGSLMWDLDSYTKMMWKFPWQQYGIDWMTSFENRTIRYYAEPRHATQAIAEETIKLMDRYREQPLFLYTSFTAAHSPLQPDPESAKRCQHIPHLWRRQFCGMVVGLDTAIGQIHQAAQEKLGSNTVIVVSSDNGGSVWFGGLNQPLRSGKHTPFEGGVRVPAFAIDLSGSYLGEGGRKINSLIHISDWLPTFMKWAGAEKLLEGLKLDGIDQSDTLKTGVGVRNEVLLELYTKNDVHDGREMAALRRGRYKVIKGDVKDWYWYTESKGDYITTSDTWVFPRVLIEKAARFLDFYFGNGKPEMLKKLLLHFGVFSVNRKRIGHQVMLFDLQEDPEEKINIAEQNPDIVELLLNRIAEIKDNETVQQIYWMQSKKWENSFVPGDCSADPSISQERCRFVTFFLGDDEVIEADDIIDAIKDLKLKALVWVGMRFGIAFGIILLVYFVYHSMKSNSPKTPVGKKTQ